MIISINCNSLDFLLKIVATLFKTVQWVIPIIIIFLITIDVFKVVVGNADEKAKQEAGSRIVKRIIYALLAFLVPMLVKMIFNVIGNDANSWISCFNRYF